MTFLTFRARPLALLGALVALLATTTLFFARVPAGRAAPSVEIEPSIMLDEVATGFDQPVDIASAGDERLFIVEQTGKIRIIEGDGTVRPTPFLDLSADICLSYEAGLLGMVFHPDYASNGYFFVNYTTPRGGSCDEFDSHISRFHVSEDSNVADPASERVIVAVEQPYSNHNAGDLAFGPDGFLYFGLGDGGAGNDPDNRAQNGMTLLGKMIRIAPRTEPDADPPYTVPASNPFISDPTVRDEIWAIGFRNPWRFSFDRLTGDMYIGDVGESEREEIDFQPAASMGGENYGWRCFEGSVDTGLCTSPDPAAYVFPIDEYSHALGYAVTGGFVYRGSDFPYLRGWYLYADFAVGHFWALKRDEGGTWQKLDLGQFPDTSPYWNISSFGENHEGELFVARHEIGAPTDGAIYRIRDTSPSPVYLPLSFKP